MSSDDPVAARLLLEHDQIRSISAELTGFTDAPSPPLNDRLTECRWTLARVMLRHLPVEDRHIFRRLEAHPDPGVRGAMARFRHDLNDVYALYQRHSDRWTERAVREDWDEYGTTTRHLLAALNRMMDREEAELYPHLAGAPMMAEGRSADARNWAGDAWAIRANLGR